MAEIKLRNESKFEFTDISSEKSRTYRFPNDEIILINEPQYLNVSRSGGHRIVNSHGVSFYIPKGWILLSWEAKENSPHFVK